MFEQSFKNIDNELHKDAGCSTEMDYIEQTSWLLFLKYLEDLENNRAMEAELNGKKYTPILDKDYTWSSWAYPKGADGKLDYHKAMTGDDLVEFVNKKLFPHLARFKELAEAADTLEYKIGVIFSEIRNKINDGYILRTVINIMQEMRFQTSEEKHELSELYEGKIQNMGNSGRNGGEYYTPRPLIRAIINVVQPKLGDKIYDGACGSAGFLVEAFNYIKNSYYFFTLAFVIEGKNEIFNLNTNKQLLDKTIKLMEDWPEKKREEFIHKMKKFRNYLNRKAIDKKTLSDIGITVHIMSTIIEFLMVKANAKHIYWISDRDTITSFQDGIVHEFIRLGCASLLNRRIPDDQMYGFVDAKEYDKEICDEFIRVPDYICGSLASMDFNNVEEIPDKHYDLFDKSIVDNERIFIMNIKHGENEDTLSDLKFTRS